MSKRIRTYQVSELIYFPRQHTLSDFIAEDMLDQGVEWSRQAIENYVFEDVHHIAKALSFQSDMFAFGMEPYLLLLRRGELATVRRGIAKMLDAHRRMLDAVQPLMQVRRLVAQLGHVALGTPRSLLGGHASAAKLVDRRILTLVLSFRVVERSHGRLLEQRDEPLLAFDALLEGLHEAMPRATEQHNISAAKQA